MEFNVLEHKLVPEHRALDQKEVKGVLKDLGVDKDRLPKIRKSDAAIRELEEIMGKDLEEGTVIEIVRLSEVAGPTKVYRLLVKG